MSAINLGIHFSLMIEVIHEGGVDLRKREMRMLQMNLFGTMPASEMIEHDLDDFHVRVVNPGECDSKPLQSLVEIRAGESQKQPRSVTQM